MKKIFVLAIPLLGLLLLVPFYVSASSVVSITPSAQDVSDMISGAPENVELFAWMTNIDSDYEVIFSVDPEPVMLVLVGADMDANNRWVNNGDGTITVNFLSRELIDSNADLPEGSTISIIALVPAVELGEDGPPQEMNGSYLATNVSSWQLIPPTENSVSFGYQLSGPAGEKGYIHMFMPDSLIDLMSQFSGKDLAIKDLAVYNDDSQYSLAVDAVAGGALVNVNVIFSEGNTVNPTALSSTITKKVTVEEKLPISLAAKKVSVKENNKTKLYGWLKSGAKNKVVRIYKKVGNNEYELWKKAQTGKNGYFFQEVTVTENAKYKAKYNGKISPIVQISVK